MDRPGWRTRLVGYLGLILRAAVVVGVVGAALWWLLLAPVTIRSHTVVRGAIDHEVLGTGTLEARTSATIGAKLSGRIAEIAVDQGAVVEAGGLLFRLEDHDIRQQVQLAEAEVAVAEAGLVRLQAVRGAAEARRVQAAANHARMQSLAANNSVAQSEWERAVEALAVAESEQASAEAAIAEGQRRSEAAQRALDYQRTRLEDTVVRMPFAGIVVRRDRELGDVVTAAAAVLHVVDPGEMWITAWVDETELARLKPEQPARIVFRSEPEREYLGAVARIGREVDRETRELTVDVRLERLPETWAVGQRAEVYLRVDHRDDATLLPAELILIRDGKPGVIVAAEGRAQWREIAIGLRSRGQVEITRGLEAGDVVLDAATVRSGQLRDGRRIRVATP